MESHRISMRFYSDLTDGSLSDSGIPKLNCKQTGIMRCPGINVNNNIKDSRLWIMKDRHQSI